MIGTTLSHYEILEKIGAGGMGEVYRARDAALARDVAIKVLPAELSHDPERLARFEREARLLASLNHPHVATLYGFETDADSGTRFLVMELVEGETLEARIARGPVPVEEAVPLFCQMAEGLEAAHAKGVIHRDLKPGNVKLTPEGRVKVLDFGLAKAFAAQPASGPRSESPTLTRSPTESGVIMGTAAYMSPEQARGKPLDERTDIWSFGCCLFEALTARPAFEAETVSDTIARILEREPAWDALPRVVPRNIRDVLTWCLTKDASMRLHDIADARIAMLRSTEPDGSSSRTADASRRSVRALWTAVAVAIASLLLALASLFRPSEPASKPVIRSILPLPEGAPLALHDASSSVAISPDGRYIAYLAGPNDARALYLRRVDELEARQVEGSADAMTPFFSPDSEWVGFAKDRALFRVAVSGGAPTRVAEFGGFATGVDWSGENIVFSEGFGGLLSVPASGGERRAITHLNPGRREKAHRFPQVLPRGEAVLFTIATSTTTSWDDASIAVANLSTGEYKVVLQGGAHARYSPSGHLLYVRGGDLHAIRFDLTELETLGQPVAVLPGVMTDIAIGAAEFTMAEEGTLVYAPGRSRTYDRRVIWIDRSGHVTPMIESPRPWAEVSLSPDGNKLALQGQGGINSIWLYEITRGTLTRWTSEWDNGTAVWDPTSRFLAFTSARAGAWNLYTRSVEGDEPTERLTTADYTQVASSWSPDGSVLLFHEYRSDSGVDVFTLALNGEQTPRAFLDGRANEMWASFSPDGKWIAYQSDETGSFEIYVQQFPDGGGRRPVSTSGGSFPVWSPGGGEIFYRNGDKMLSVAVDVAVDVEVDGGGGEMILGRPVMLFERHRNPQFPNFAVTPDGRFIDLDDSVAEPAPTRLVLVQGFGEELERLLPPR